MSLKSYFRRAFCINLAKRTDRRAHAEEQAKKLNLPITWIDAHEAFNPGDGIVQNHAGCTASHRAVLELIAFHKIERALVLEDDFDAVYPDTNERFAKMVPEIPDDFDVVYLGGSFGEAPVARVSPHIIRCGRMMTTSSYGITWQAARKMAPHIAGLGPIDCLFGGFAKTLNMYCVYPRLFVQYTCHSDIQGVVANNSMSQLDSHHIATLDGHRDHRPEDVRCKEMP